MKKFSLYLVIALLITPLLSVNKVATEEYSISVSVKNLRNSKGHVQFSLYNKKGTIPDEDLKKYYMKLNGDIKNNSASVIFKNIPKGKYAINILHDENENGKIDKGWIMPIEGIGFSNFSSIGFSNRPNFEKASFELNENTTKSIKVIYL